MASSNFMYELDIEEYCSNELMNPSTKYMEDLEKELLYWRQLACQHDLTKLPNRRAFHLAIESYLCKTDRQFQKVVLFYIDINQFKLINDTYGHDVADELLKEFGCRLQNVFGEEVFHFSGDEFVIISQYQEDYQSQIDKIQSICQKPLQVENEEIKVGISIGASLYPVHSKDISTLLKYADSAMYSAKRSKNTTFFLYQ